MFTFISRHILLILCLSVLSQVLVSKNKGIKVYTMSKRKYKTLSVSEKLKLLSDYDCGKSRDELCRENNIPMSTLCRIIKNNEKIRSQCIEGKGKLKRIRAAEYPEVEKCLCTWIKQVRNNNIPISGPMIKEKAQEFASKLHIDNFSGSNGWLEGFKKRNDIAFKNVCGESNSVDNNECNEWIKNLPALLHDYSPDDVFNADEAGLFYKCLPDKTFTFKGQPCHGGKLSKDRVTVLVSANMSGTEKLPLFLIGKSKRPRCFKGIKTLPVKYQNNKKAWMTSELFADWLKKVNADMRAQKRKIIMFVDNCTAHNNMPKLDYVQLLYLPTNTTSKLQPMDQGIINNFKVYYRKEVVQYVLKSIEENKSPEINILQAMRFARKAWFSVSKTTISNCFKKAGFKVTNVSEPESVQEELEICPEWDRMFATCRNNLNEQQATFQDFVSMDDNVLISEELNDDDIVAMYSSLDTEEEEEEGDCEETPVKISKREAMEALETLHKYFEMSNIDNSNIFDQIYSIEKQVLATNNQVQTNITDYFN